MKQGSGSLKAFQRWSGPFWNAKYCFDVFFIRLSWENFVAIFRLIKMPGLGLMVLRKYIHMYCTDLFQSFWDKASLYFWSCIERCDLFMAIFLWISQCCVPFCESGYSAWKEVFQKRERKRKLWSSNWEKRHVALTVTTHWLLTGLIRQTSRPRLYLN